MIIQRLFSSKEQKARRSKWDKKVAEDIHGKLDIMQAKSLGRRVSRLSNIEKDHTGKYKIDYEPSSQNILNRESNEILSASKPIKDGVYYGGREEVISRAVHQDKRLGKSGDSMTLKIINKFKESDKKEAEKQLKKKLKKGGKIALATGGVVAAGIGAKKLVDKKKAKKEEKK